MAFILLMILIILEIGFIAYELTKAPLKKEWSLKRCIADVAELIAFIIMLIFPDIDLSFRFKGLIIILIIRIVISGLFALKNIKNEKTKKKYGIILSGMGSILLFAFFITPAFIFTDYNGRELTGEYEVAEKKAILVDKSRVEEFENDGSFREVPIYLYYPVNYDGNDNTLPLVIFSHGAFGYYQSNASTYLELASHGYVVASIEHPYHALFTHDSTGKLIMADSHFFDSAYTIGGSEDEGGLSEEELFEVTSKWMDLREKDMNFVIDTLKDASKNGCSDAWCFTADSKEDIEDTVSLIDDTKIGLMGHSLGGATAVTVGRRDDVSAAIDLDGTMLGEETGVKDGQCVINDELYTTPLLSIDSVLHHNDRLKSGQMGLIYANDVILDNATDGYNTYFNDTAHMNFTDLPLFSPFLAKNLGMGSVDPGECIDQVNKLCLEFFDTYLKGQGQFSVNECY